MNREGTGAGGISQTLSDFRGCKLTKCNKMNILKSDFGLFFNLNIKTKVLREKTSQKPKTEHSMKNCCFTPAVSRLNKNLNNPSTHQLQLESNQEQILNKKKHK